MVDGSSEVFLKLRFFQLFQKFELNKHLLHGFH